MIDIRPTRQELLDWAVAEGIIEAYAARDGWTSVTVEQRTLRFGDEQIDRFLSTVFGVTEPRLRSRQPRPVATAE